MYLGIDLGTSELKLVLLAPDERRIVATAREPLTVDRPRPLWSEQDPAAWWRALDAAMTRLASAEPAAMRQVRGIGLAGQMHGAVVLDAADRVLRPAILWNDGRSGAQCEALTRDWPELAQVTGNLAMPGFTAPKLLWLREHEPDVFARTARVLLPKDHLRLLLTGEAISDLSDASGTLWLDVGARDWSDRALAACGMTRAQMPALAEGSAPAGVLRGELARRWGLTDDGGAGTITVAGGGGDNAASAVGIGAVEPGQGFVSLGTSGVIFRVSDGFRPNPAQAIHAFCHALPGRWHQMSVMLSAASCLNWAAALTGCADVPALLARAATLTPAQRDRAPLFLPYLSGERTPHNDPAAQGVLFGLTNGHGGADVAWAVLEGVSFGLRDGWQGLAGPAGAVPARQALPGEAPPPAAVAAVPPSPPPRAASAAMPPPPSLALVGGGARSALWGQLLASVLDTQLDERPGNEAAGAVGAARLGWLACGGALADVCRPADDGAADRSFAPDPSERDRLHARYRRFRALYPALRAQFSA